MWEYGPMTKRGPQTMEIPTPGTLDRWNQMLYGAYDVGKNSPYAIYKGEKARGRFMVGDKECCDCPPSMGQPAVSPPGLQQPSLPQKPFQSAGQDQCSYVDSVLQGMGLSLKMLCECCGGRRGSSGSRAKSRKGSTGRRGSSTKRGSRIQPWDAERADVVAGRRSGTRGGGARTVRKAPVYKWYPMTANRSRSLCRDTANNLIVRKALCGK